MDFALILLICVAVTGAVWFLDTLWRLITRKIVVSNSNKPARGRWIVEYARAFFPILLIVFVLRSFVVEPFRIPSGSMLPTLQNGDFILVNKYRYGIRVPLTNDKILEIENPDRGDVMVFKYPHDASVNFIKRVVGLPGDKIIYDKKKLYINGEEIEQEFIEETVVRPSANRAITVSVLSESLGENMHRVQIDEVKRKRTDYEMDFTVPENHYFVLGDNRDYSNDSRFWGFVPDENVIGKAFLIWFSWNSAEKDVNWSRIAEAIE